MKVDSRELEKLLFDTIAKYFADKNVTPFEHVVMQWDALTCLSGFLIYRMSVRLDKEPDKLIEDFVDQIKSNIKVQKRITAKKREG